MLTDENVQLPLCPRCGKAGGFIVKARLSGSADQVFFEDGSFDQDINNNLYLVVNSQVVRCAICKRIRRDVRLGDDSIIPNP